MNGLKKEEGRKTKGKAYVCCGLLVLLLMTTGCDSRPVSLTESSPSQRTMVSMIYPQALEHFEALIENTYPDIDLQVEISTTATINGDSERRLRNGHGTDLIVTTLPTGDVQDYTLDLSAEEFVSDYQVTAMNPVMIKGQTRYLPLPGQYSGYVLNKTLMEQLGKSLPESNDELLALFGAGKEQGIGIGGDGTMFGITIVDTAAVGSYIIGTQVPDFLGMPDGIKWMTEFQDGTAKFSGVWNNSLNLLLACVERGYLSSQSLSLMTANSIPVKKRMLDGTLLLSYGNVNLFTWLTEQSDKYEYVMFPFLSDDGNKSWALSAPDAYLAINNAVSRDKTKLDACQRILGLLSTQEGQEAWIEDSSATTSYMMDYKAKNNVVPPGFTDCVGKGYVYSLQMPSNVIQYFGRNMISVLDGKAEMTDALAAVDDYCRNGSADVDYDQSVVGSVAEDLLYENYNTRQEETAIGNLVADAVAGYTGADIAVVNGGSIRASLYAGDVLGEDLAAVCPYFNKVILVEADGASILEMLENGISQTERMDAIPSGRFLQVSGLCYSYQPVDGDRPAKLLSVTLADGTALEKNAHYSLAITDYMAGSSGYFDNNGDGFTMLNLYSDAIPKTKNVKLLKETNATYVDAMKEYFYHHQDKEISVNLEGRIKVVRGDE